VFERARRHLTYANVIATLTLFAVLAGGTAVAASHLGRNTVGSKQLKKNSVTTAKIKKNAVTTAKIRNGAVDESKLKPGSLNRSDLEPGLPFGQIVGSLRGGGVVTPDPEGSVYPLSTSSFVQEAGTALMVVGGVDFSIPAGCTEAEVSAEALIDPPAQLEFPLELQGSIAALGFYESAGDIGQRTVRVTLSPSDRAGLVAQPSPQKRTVALVVYAECESGGPITATFGGLDLIGNR
jgi:hypothetical protein